MPTSIVFFSFVEAILFVTTVVLLSRSKKPATKSSRVRIWVGVIFLAVTFVWSIIFGIVMSLNGYSVRV